MRHALWWLLGIALLAHGAGLRNGFVYDDHRFVAENPALERASVAQILLDPGVQTSDRDRDVYRPLRALGHALDLRQWGHQPFGFHLHSLLAHLANVALGFVLLRRLLPAPADAPALLGATLLAVHPLGVEVAGWISSRGDLYALGFALLALLCLVPSEGARTPGKARLAAAAACAGLACLGKESAVWLPLVALLGWRLLGRVRPAGVVAVTLGVAGALLLRQVALGNLSPVQTAPHGGSWFQQAGWALYGTGRTLLAIVWPAGLSIEYPQVEWAQGTSVWVRGPTLLALAAVITAVALRRRRPAAALLLGWVLLAWLPSSSLLVTLRSLVNDRGSYPCLLAAGALAGLALAGRPRLAFGASAALALVLVPLSIARTAAFADDARLWQDVLLHDSRSVRAHLGLAVVAPDADVAEREFQAALAVAAPGSRLDGVASARLGDFLLRTRGDAARALPLLERSLEVQRRQRDRAGPGPDEAATAASLAECLMLLGRNEDSDRVLQVALRDDPGQIMLHIKRAALALLRAERDGDPAARALALSALDQARALDPQHPLVHMLAERLQGGAVAPR